MNKKKKLFCFIDTIESWDYLKKKYKDFNKIICTASPELLLDNNIKEKKIIIDGKKISIIKPLANDLGDVCEKIVKKIKSKGVSHNFAIQYTQFIFGFSALLRFSTMINDSYLTTKKIIIVKSKSKNPIFKNALNLPIEKILKQNKDLEIKTINIPEKKFQSFLKSPNFISRLILNGAKNFEFLIWRKIWQFWPGNLTKGIVLLGIDGSFLRETAVYMSRLGYKFKTLPKRNIKKFSNTDHNLLRKINFAEKDLNKIFKKYITQKLAKNIFKIFKNETKLFIERYNYNYKFWKNYLSENLDYSEIKCFLSTHLSHYAFLALSDILIKKKIPIFNFQHGHAREFRFSPEHDKWSPNFEPIADETFVYNQNSKKRSMLVNKVARGKFTSVGVPSFYKKNKILFNSPKYQIIFLQHATYTGIRKSHIPFTIWSDNKKINFEFDMIDKVFKKLPYNILYKLYPSPANLSENIIKKKISNYQNISLVEKNIDANYFFYSKRIIITYNACSTFGWALLSKLPLVFINLDLMPLKNEFKKNMSKSIFYFDYKDKKIFENLNNFLSQPLDKIFTLWNKKKKYRDRLLREFADDKTHSAGKLASQHILNKLS